MNKEITLILLLFLNVKSALSQEYVDNIVNPFDCDSVAHFGLEYFSENITCLMGYCKGDEVVIPPKYAYTQGFCKKGIARVTNKSPYDNSMLSPDRHGGYFMMNIMTDNSGLNGFIDTLGNVVIPIKYSSIGLLEVYDVVPYSLYIQENGKRIQKYGLINDKGEIVTEPIYDFVYQHGKRVFEARIYKEDKIENSFYIDEAGKKLIDGGRFDKFRVVSKNPPLLFYAEHNETAYLLNSDLIPYTSTYMPQFKDRQRAIEVLQEDYIYTYELLANDLQKFYEDMTEEMARE